MLQITITEIDFEEEGNSNQMAIELIDKAEEIIDALLHLSDFDAPSHVELKLTEVSKLLFNAQCRLNDYMDIRTMN